MYDAENVAFKYSRLRRHLKANKLSLNPIKTELMFIGPQHAELISKLCDLKDVTFWMCILLVRFAVNH